MATDLILKGALVLVFILFVLDYFLTAWRVRSIARDTRRIVALLDRLVDLTSSQTIAQRVGSRSVGDVQLRPR